ncbi:MAG: DUF5828 family protein [Candidatus Natronoplasma sp.]
MEGVKITNSGLELEGDWREICEFCSELEVAMEKYLESKEEIDEFEEWMPHEEDSDEDMKLKTAEEAAVKERNIERDFEGAKEELNKAGKNMAKSVEDIRNGVSPSKDLKEALVEIEKVLGVESLRSLRKIEETIYERLMLKLNPYYFDTEDFSVNLERKNKGGYCLSINVTDESLRKHFQKRCG